jgi:hypothetical protein
MMTVGFQKHALELGSAKVPMIPYIFKHIAGMYQNRLINSEPKLNSLKLIIAEVNEMIEPV